MPECFPIIGGGPAGAAAGIAAARAGLHPIIYEQSAARRHKVCGEFFSPEIVTVLDGLGLVEGFLARQPARITHAELHFSGRCRRFRLPEPAYGLSRYEFDYYLLREAATRGATIRRERFTERDRPAICATGRWRDGVRGRRIFGFKAHFSGPASEAVEMYFFAGGYCGVAPVEGGVVNVCGLARERLLVAHGFKVDRMLAGMLRLRERLGRLERATQWHVTGPLAFGMSCAAPAWWLPAGDAACFMDPFTGTGLLAAVQTGAWAGEALVRAAEGEPWKECREWHDRLCREFFRRQLATTVIARRLLDLGWAESLAGIVPGALLFRLTRPRVHPGSRSLTVYGRSPYT